MYLLEDFGIRFIAGVGMWLIYTDGQAVLMGGEKKVGGGFRSDRGWREL